MNAISIELLDSFKNQPDGIAGLDNNGYLDPSVFPPGTTETYKGAFTDLAALQAAFPTASVEDYASVGADNARYYWSAIQGAWIAQQITYTDWLTLTAAQKDEYFGYFITV